MRTLPGDEAHLRKGLQTPLDAIHTSPRVSAACLLRGRRFDASAKAVAADIRSMLGMAPDQISSAVERRRPRGAKTRRLKQPPAASGGAGALPDGSVLWRMRSFRRVVAPMHDGLHVYTTRALRLQLLVLQETVKPCGPCRTAAAAVRSIQQSSDSRLTAAAHSTDGAQPTAAQPQPVDRDEHNRRQAETFDAVAESWEEDHDPEILKVHAVEVMPGCARCLRSPGCAEEPTATRRWRGAALCLVRRAQGLVSSLEMTESGRQAPLLLRSLCVCQYCSMAQRMQNRVRH